MSISGVLRTASIFSTRFPDFESLEISIGVTLPSVLEAGDSRKKNPESRRSVQSQPGNVLEQRAMPHLDWLLLNHPRTSKDIGNAESPMVDGERNVRLPGELEVRAFELHECFGPRRRSNHGASHRAIDGLRRVSRILYLD